MKYVAVAALALVLGLVLGGLAPRAELRALENQVAEARASDAECRSTLGQDLATLMAGAREARAPQPPRDRNPLGDRDPDTLAAENPEAAELAAEMDAEREAAGEAMADPIRDIDPEQLELARTALELRRSQARAALLEDAQPSERQMEDIDNAVRGMNDRLMGLAGELVTMIESGQEPSRYDAMSFAADALDTMLAAEDDMRSALDPDQLEGIDDSVLDPFSFVDPELVTLLESMGAPE